MCYFSAALQPKKMKKIAKTTKDILTLLNIPMDYVVGRGVSGVLALPAYAEAMKAKIAISRKEDSSHSGGNRIEVADSYDWRDSSAIIVDDFISSGETMKNIYAQIGCDHKVKAICLYCPCSPDMIYGAIYMETIAPCPIVGISEGGTQIYTKNITDEQKQLVKEYAQSHKYAHRDYDDS